MTDLFLLLLGVTGLWAGTVVTLGGALRLSDRTGLSQGFIGMTVLAIGTDVPELFVTLSGSLRQLQGIDASGMIVGNAVGSVIAQGTVVLGVAGLFGYLSVPIRTIRRDIAILLLATILLGVLSLDGRISRVEGAALMIAYLVYMVALAQAEQLVRDRTEEARHGPAGTGRGRMPTWLLLVTGLVTVLLSAHVVITEGVELATRWGVSQTVLGILILGVGTSLPELILTLGAATRGHAAMSLGNVIGSNIFDLLVPMGLGGAIHPLTVAEEVVSFDLPVSGVGTLLLLLFLLRRRGLQRREALVLLSFFLLYAALRIGIE